MENVIICRKGEKIKTVTLDGVQIDLLVKTNVLELMRITMEPGASLGPPYKHVGQEAHLILRGEIEAQVGEQTYSLKEGDTICFSSLLPHTGKNPGKEKLIYCSVTSPPTFI